MKKVVGKGKVKLCFDDGRVKTIDNVVHILGVAINLLFVSMLNDSRVHVTFDKSGCRMVRGSLVIAKGSQMRTLFRLNASTLF